MKSILILVLIASCSSAWADSGDNLDAAQLNAGSTLTFTQGLIIPPGAEILAGSYDCKVTAQDGAGNTINSESQIAANSALTLVSTTPWRATVNVCGGSETTGSDDLKLTTETGSLILLSCEANFTAHDCNGSYSSAFSYSTPISIGEFKSLLSSVGGVLSVAQPPSL